MAGTTYSKFFWQDWKSDEELKSCSMGARGLWMYLLCFAASATPVGHVLIGGEKPTPARIKKAVGADESEDQIQAWLDDLVAAKVCDVTRDGCMVSRRLVRDARRRQISVAGGKSRQKQLRETTEENAIGTRRVVQPPSATSQSPSTTSQQPARTLQQDCERVEKLGTAIGIDVTTHPGGDRFITQLVKMEQAGIDFEKDLLPAIEKWRARGGVASELRALSYFRPGAQENRDARLMAGQLEANRASAPFEDTDEKGWHLRLSIWIRIGYWPAKYGPMPRTDQCRADRRLLGLARAKWIENGGHPTEGFCAYGDRYTAWTDVLKLRRDGQSDYGDDNVIPLPAKRA